VDGTYLVDTDDRSSQTSSIGLSEERGMHEKMSKNILWCVGCVWAVTCNAHLRQTQVDVQLYYIIPCACAVRASRFSFQISPRAQPFTRCGYLLALKAVSNLPKLRNFFSFNLRSN
jgi:hypothetical protein